MPIPFEFDFKKPDYKMVTLWRAERLVALRKENEQTGTTFAQLKRFYRNDPAQFIIDWGMTFDPRNAARQLPTIIPFVLTPKQEELVHFIFERIMGQKNALVEKSRETGVSWLVMSLFSTMCMLVPNLVFGVGSRKEEYVDSLKSPKALMYKARQYIQYVPMEFREGWDIKKHAPFKTITFPSTGSVINGEAGDGIGRGDRALAYLVDEEAFLEHPETVEASLSQTTNSVISVSTVNGMNNPFARKRWGGNIDVFTLHWSDDLRKDEAWYADQCKRLDYNEAVIAQELDINYNASVTGIIIPSVWVEAAVDAHIKLGIKVSGPRIAALDIADQGRDKNAICGGQGIVIDYVEEWAGKNSDIFASVERAITLCDTLDYMQLRYDSDGLGASARGDSRIINEKRENQGLKTIECVPFWGSGAVVDPDEEVFPARDDQESENSKGRTNLDFFQNAKAQAWWNLAKRFKKTWRAVTMGDDFDPDELISISSACPNYQQLKIELSQPTWVQSKTGKLMVDKIPDGGRSPNKADACMMWNAKLEELPAGFF